jgi:UDP-N-acetyl-D-glucosamine/UDP-N-acetyl-D-galactosamine dehydrogenase
VNLDKKIIAIVGLGYVGLPLAVEFGRLRPVIGFDIGLKRITDLQQGFDTTREVEKGELENAKFLTFSSNADDLKKCGIYLVAVPTPIDRARRPDLSIIAKATEMVGKSLSKGDLVIYESTVYPGCTRDFCVPILEHISGLKFNEDFFVGYSPERANPGDKVHRLNNILKLTSGSTPEVALAVDQLYRLIVKAGTHSTASIEVAEAAKVVENTQRDLNIALMNELAVIFHKLDIDTNDVLEAAATKWNFQHFKPGLVGGHCIGVDPYYLTHRAEEIGYHPEVILAGRRINDSMASHVADRVARLMMKNGFPVVGSRILVLGLSFKENCPDIRNSKVVDVVSSLRDYHAQVDIFDPWVDPFDAEHEYGLKMLKELPEAKPIPIYDAVVVTVGHKEFHAIGTEFIRGLCKPNGVLFDVKGIFAKDSVDGRL